MESIKNIKEKYNTMEPASFIEAFSDDERAGVKNLVLSMEKRIQALDKEKERMYAMFSFEREYAAFSYICGIDEVGRGPLAGPVVAAAVILPKDCDILYLNDSKKLSAAKREELNLIIREKALSFGIGFTDHTRIDEINILNATFESMRDAVKKLDPSPDILLNDAVTIPGIKIKQVPIIKGDAKSASIAAASIIAKVERDHYMEKMDELYPGYGFKSNKGYGSSEHIEALKNKGPCPIHRKSFIGNFV